MGVRGGSYDIRSLEDYALGFRRIEGPWTTVFDTCVTAFGMAAFIWVWVISVIGSAASLYNYHGLGWHCHFAFGMSGWVLDGWISTA
jgi:hypothetical protein